ncbi:nucleotidyltransferase domain-containing protein, partial [Candidatus Woesearchaeota archaeon]|nr:nucleotidyltransferase domain-containing protein [Candidatus Woesearchaeota archaeon]
MENYLKSSKKLYQNYKDKIIDIVLFGSSVKGKYSPADIDIAIILKNVKESEFIILIKKFNIYFYN